MSQDIESIGPSLTMCFHVSEQQDPHWLNQSSGRVNGAEVTLLISLRHLRGSHSQTYLIGASLIAANI